MNGFYLVFIVLCILWIAHTLTHSEKNKPLLFMAAGTVLVVFFCTQSGEVGADTKQYVSRYTWIANEASFFELLSFGWEQGYVLLNKLLSLLSREPRMLLVGMSFLILFPFFRWFHAESSVPMLSLICFVALGFWDMSMYIYRQWCAMALLTFSYRYIRKRQFKLFLILVVVAMFFHRTAAVALPLYFLYGLKLDKRLLMIAAGLSVLLGISGKPILAVLNLFARIPEEGNFNGGINMLLVLWAIVLLTYWLEKDNLRKPQVRLPFVMVLTAAVIQPVAFTFSIWARIVQYYNIALVMLIPVLYQSVCCRSKNNKVLMLVGQVSPSAAKKLASVYHTKGFRLVTQILVCLVLLVWYIMVHNGTHYAFGAA